MDKSILDIINEELTPSKKGDWSPQESRKNPLSYELGGINIKIYIDGKTNGRIYDKIKNPFSIKNKIKQRTGGSHISFEVFDDFGEKKQKWYVDWKKWWSENQKYYKQIDDEWVI